MKSKNYIESSWESEISSLSQVIEHARQNIVRVSHCRMIILFWRIGQQLNEHLGKSSEGKYDKSILTNISSELVLRYGEYFLRRNLERMRLLANQLNDQTTVSLIASCISWEHISLLMETQNLEAILFYFKATLEQGLSVTKLRKQISMELFERSKNYNRSKSNRDSLEKKLNQEILGSQAFSQMFQPELIRSHKTDRLIKNIFKEPLLSSFRPLLDLSKKTPNLYRNKTFDFNGELQELCMQYIEDFKQQQNRWLNMQLNLCFRQVGKQINDLVGVMSENKATKIKNASMLLEKKYGKCFTEKQLQAMSKFAEQFYDLNIAVRIAALVSWSHILVLLPIEDLKGELFYARLTAVKKLTIASLRKQISKNVFGRTSGAKEREESILTELAKMTTKTNVMNEKNATVTVKSNIINHVGNDDGYINTQNIFDNTYFFNFVN